MEIVRIANEWQAYSTISYFEYHMPNLTLFDWIESDSLKYRPKWVLKYARMWDVYNNGQWLGYMAATSHYKGRWVFHFGAAKGIDHKSVIPAAWRLFLKEAQKEKVQMVAVYIFNERDDIKRLARIFKFRHYFGELWAKHLKPLKLNQSSKLPHRCELKMIT